MAPIRALLVDDEPELVFTMAERLEIRGFEVVAVTSAEEAVGQLDGPPFDVGVFDVKMPGMGGIELVMHLRQGGNAMPIILLTGHGAVTGDGEGLGLGTHTYLFKPVKIDTLVATMRELAGEVG